jgi:pyruvate/2-oxoglutarate/acetoin dehydrogenase E1 component
VLKKKNEYFEYSLVGSKFSSVLIEPKNSEVDTLVICYGYLARMIHDSYVEIFAKSDSVFKILCVQTLDPFPIEHVNTISNFDDKIIVLEEGSENYGWASNIVGKLCNQGYTQLKYQGSKNYCIPSTRKLESEVLISIEDIVDTMKNEN